MRILGFAVAIGLAAGIGGGLVWAVQSETGTVPDTIVRADGWKFHVTPARIEGLDDCVACHRMTPTGAERSAPTLWGIVGAPVAGADWFGYSPALARKGDVWDRAALDSYLAAPTAFVPGTFKTMSPVRDADARARIIDALQALR